MSEGNRSLVNWTRRNVPPSAAASARASVVLPTPGMSSISRWPRDSSATTAARIASGLPWMTVAIASSSRRTAPMSVLPGGLGTAGAAAEVLTFARLAAVQLHQQPQHVPEQRRDGPEQHQRGGHVRRRWEVPEDEAGLVEDVAGHQRDHRGAEHDAEREAEHDRGDDQ